MTYGNMKGSSSADAIPLDPERLDVFAASSRGLGELIASVGECPRLLVCLGGTATMDGGSGLLEVLDGLPGPTTVLCDTRATLLEAPGAFGPQKGASPADIEELERRFRGLPCGELPGSGAAGGLGAALASLGAELVSGARYVLDAIRFRERASRAELVVTGEGTVDRRASRERRAEPDLLSAGERDHTAGRDQQLQLDRRCIQLHAAARLQAPGEELIGDRPGR